MHGLPKVHKPAVPLRPILSTIGSCNHEAAKWLTGKLSFFRDHSTNIKDSFKFIDEIKDKCFQNKIMVSFGVKRLLTNIPVSFTIKLNIDALYHNGTFSNSNILFSGFNQTKIKQFLEWVTKSGTLLFNNDYFEQLDGIPMGGKASNLFADVIMNYIVNKAMEITPLQYRPSVFYRYVDDCFSVSNDKKSVTEFEKILNSLHPNIAFTTKLQSKNCLNFLDVLIDNSGTNLVTDTYHKTTHTGLYTKWNSFVPRRFKINLFNCLLDRCYRICSSFETIYDEFEQIKTMLSKNGYPKFV